MVVVPVMDCQLAQLFPRKLAAASTAYMWKKLERLIAVTLLAYLLCASCFRNDLALSIDFGMLSFLCHFRNPKSLAIR